MINQISKFIGKFMGLVFGPENHTSHIELDKPIELRESNQNQIKIESIKALKEIESFNHDSLKSRPMPKNPVPINEPIKNEHIQEKTSQESQPEPPKPEPSSNGNKPLTFAEKIELIRSKRDKI